MTITIDRAMLVPTRTARGKAGEDRRLIVSASKLAQHLDCVRSYLAKLSKPKASSSAWLAASIWISPGRATFDICAASGSCHGAARWTRNSRSRRRG